MLLGLQTLSKEFTKDEHVISLGGPLNRLDSDLNYETENDVAAFPRTASTLMWVLFAF
jgi:hypothetical protein